MTKSKFFKKFLGGIAAALGTLVVTFIVAYILKFIDIGYKFGVKHGMKGGLEILTDYKYWITSIGIIIFIFLFLPIITYTIINKRQDKFPSFFSINPGGYVSKYKEDVRHSGLDWQIYFNAHSYGKNNNKIEVERVDGPYCKNDKRKMNESRTYFGRFKYKCPKCRYKKNLLKNSYTIENEIIDELKSEFR